MAENGVSLARDRLIPFFTEVANMIRGVPSEVSDMKNELEMIQAIIQDADRMNEAEGDYRNDEIKRKLRVIIETSFHLEDVIDEYTIYEESPWNPGCAAIACEPINFIKNMIFRLQMSYMIRDIKSNFRAINESSSGDHGFKSSAYIDQGQCSSGEKQNHRLQMIRQAPRYMDEAQIVGFEAHKNELIDLLVEGRAERTVICVVGMGGLGKTTLAKSVFDNKNVIQYFHCAAWITVSQSYTAESLLRDMLLSFCKQSNMCLKNISTMDENSLILELRNYLHQKRYFLLFDDVWDPYFWNVIEFSALDSRLGSRILITTRNFDVAMSCKKSSFVHIHELEPLSPEESRRLFHKRAFPFEPNGCCPPELEGISSEIVAKCGGNPLVIVSVAGLLSYRAQGDFVKFSQNLSLALMNNPHLSPIIKIIGFSYDDLPRHLKWCFLYFGMYPGDYEVESNRIIWQWIAEGFVKSEMGKTLEEVAEHYLTELVNRSLVQVSSSATDGEVKVCHIHDLLREMILTKFKDLRFCQYIEDLDQSVLSGGITRRLSIATISYGSIRSIGSSHVRSLLFFTSEELHEDFVREIITQYRLLKVLDFENARLYCVPDNLGNLLHLKYLSFRNTLVESLPKSIGRLQNLETLDLRQTGVHEMPKEISKLRKLQHLLADRMSLILLRDCIGGMTSLQTLHEVRIDHGGVDLIRELGMLLKLRKLGLTNVMKEHGSAISSSINNMHQLEKLYISTEDDNEVIDMDFDSSPHKHHKLYLNGKLKKFEEYPQTC